MEHPTSKVAACPIYFGANGGHFNELGQAELKEDDRLLCPKAFDCGHCGYLHEWVQARIAEGYSVSWECSRCIGVSTYRSRELDKQNGRECIIPGFYQAGQKFDTDPNSLSFDEDRPGIEGCTHILEEDNPETGQKAGELCGWETSFLQLVLRRGR